MGGAGLCVSAFMIPFHLTFVIIKIIGGICALMAVFILALPVPIIVNRSVLLLNSKLRVKLR